MTNPSKNTNGKNAQNLTQTEKAAARAEKAHAANIGMEEAVQERAQRAQERQAAQAAHDEVSTSGVEIDAPTLTETPAQPATEYTALKEALGQRDQTAKPLTGKALEIARHLSQGGNLTNALSGVVINKLHAVQVTLNDVQVFGYRFTVREQTARAADSKIDKAKYKTQHIEVLYIPTDAQRVKVQVDSTTSLDMQTSLYQLDTDKLRADVKRAEAKAQADAEKGKGKPKLSKKYRSLKAMLEALDAPSAEA